MENGHGRGREKISVTEPSLMAHNWKEDIVDWNRSSSGCGTASAPCEGEKKVGRKLVLHFDVRNTVLVADSVTNINVEQAFNSYLTGVTWGKETPGGWQWHSDTPSLTPPALDCITYYKYLEQKLVREASDRLTLRRVLGHFTQEKIGERFLPYYRKHLKMMEWNHTWTDTKLILKGTDGKLYHYILPAFFRLIQHLHEAGRNFSIVIRTYGMDCPNVLECLSFALEGNHPLLKRPIPLKINRIPGKIHRTDEQIKFEVISDNEGLKTTNIFTTERAIYDMLNKVEGVCGFVDDFRSWEGDNYSHRSGKPFWVSISDPEVQHIIFDDNIRISEDDSIVDVRTCDREIGRGRSLSQEEAAIFENICLVQADLLESTENVNYFVDKVKQCEENYEKLLKSNPPINGVL